MTEQPEAQESTGRYVYDHPEELGLGQHHADGDLKERPAAVMGPVPTPEVLDMINATDEQRAVADEIRNRTMHDLDMHHGTEVTYVGRDEDQGLELVEWTDRCGDARRTSVTPEQFSQFFKEVTT
jgi:hypothetical protein